MRVPALVILASIAPALLIACADNSQERLSKALGAQGVKSVVVSETTITATCAAGDNVEVPTAELEKSALGVKPENLKAVGQKILKTCEEKDTAKRKAEAWAGERQKRIANPARAPKPGAGSSGETSGGVLSSCASQLTRSVSDISRARVSSGSTCCQSSEDIFIFPCVRGGAGHAFAYSKAVPIIYQTDSSRKSVHVAKKIVLAAL